MTAIGLLDDEHGTITTVPIRTNGDFICPHGGEREDEAQRIVTLKDGHGDRALCP